MAGETTVLIGVVGMSPAVLTETVWALAREDPPVIPDEVVAITTKEGREAIQAKLFGKDGWDALRKKIGSRAKGKLRFGSEASIQVIGDGNSDFVDIATLQENEKAADFILKALRQYTEDPSSAIIASIAGGRKTMSALMLSCMSLLGREQDRVCHVLANDNYLSEHRDFLFPKNKAEEKQVQIQLSDIPFVRVRGLYEKELGETPSSYSNLVQQFQSAAPPAINYPKIEIQKAAGKIFADGKDLQLSPKEFQLASVLVGQFVARGKAFTWWGEVEKKIQADEEFDEQWSDARWSAVASDIRKKRLHGKPYASALIPIAGTPSTFPTENITIES